jgi:hypothetical protein
MTTLQKIAVQTLAAGALSASAEPAATNLPAAFRIWAFGDAHVGTDLKQGRESLAGAFRQSEANAACFEWNIAVDVGDNSGGQKVPEDGEGRELVRQYGALTRHTRETIYSVCGNHDRSGLTEPEAWWFQKWVDPLGEHPEASGVRAEKRPYKVEGTWERYSFRVGNLLFLMMSDINEPSQKVGRGDLGGNPAGVVRGETFAWWKRMVEANSNSIIISIHHYMLKNTTTASGEWEGMTPLPGGGYKSAYHGYYPQGAPKGASYLYFVNSVPDAQAFEHYLEANPGAVALWIGGHTHPKNPDDTAGNKPLIAEKWGVHFLNVAALTEHHNNGVRASSSRLLTFTEGSDRVRVQSYLHSNRYKPEGWYEPDEKTLALSKPFRLNSSIPKELP